MDAARDHEIQDVLKVRDVVSALFDDTLSRIRNHRRLTFIHRLPVELLSKIFRAASEHGLDVPTSYAIVSVCLHWKDVAYSDPQMWTRYDLAYSRPGEVLAALVRRSQPCPLDIYGRMVEHSPMFRTVAANIDRVSSIHNAVLSSALSSSTTSLTAPLLRHFGVTACTILNPPVLPRLPFIKNAPQLTSLELTSFRLPWRRELYSNLIRLRLLEDSAHHVLSHAVPLYHHNAADIDILEVPYGSPNLEYLEIQFPKMVRLGHYYASLPSCPATLAYRPIPMRALRTLVLDMPDEHAMRMLTGITLPESLRKLDIAVCCDIRRVELLDTLLQCRYLPAVFFTSLHSLAITRNAFPSMDVPLSVPGSIFFEGAGRVHDQDGFQFALQFESDSAIIATRNLQRLLPAHVEMPLLQKLSLSEHFPEQITRSADWLAQLLLNSRSLVTLVLDGAGFFTTFGCLHRALLEATGILPYRSIPPLEHVYISGPDCGWNQPAEVLEVIPLLQLFQAHLRELHIDVAKIRYVQATATQLVEGIRLLHVPEVWWSTPFGDPGPTRPWNVTTHARDVWPSDAPYTWRCKNGENHSEDQTPWKCEGCGAALRVAPVLVKYDSWFN